MQATERIFRLREQALACRPRWHNNERELIVARAWQNTAGLAEPEDGMGSMLVRRARVIAGVLRGLTPVIDRNELIVGKLCHRELTPDEQAELDSWRRLGRPNMPQLDGIDSHMAIDFPSILSLGVEGIKARLVSLLLPLKLHRPEDVDKAAFYRACLVALDGLLDAADRYAELARFLSASEPDSARRSELSEIADVCAKVPRQPARTFREAVQSMHFVNTMLTIACPGLYQLGRPDRYLIGYYERDFKEGKISRAQAQELWDCVCVLFNECVPRGLAVGYMVGGRDAAGLDVSNELTEIMLESCGHVRLSYPGVGLCRHAGTPPRLVELSAKLLAQGLSHPAIFNDEVITSGLAGLGLPPQDACEYIHSTCVEITPVAASGVWVASPYINLVQLLHDALGVGCVAIPRTSFEELAVAVRRGLEKAVERAVQEQNLMRAGRFHHGGQPLVSCFVKDCIERGKDIDQGGARYNWLEMSFVGLANLVDALTAIRILVFEQAELSLGELVEALENDFHERDALRLSLLNRCPKYGNDVRDVDDLAVEVAGWVEAACGRHRVYPNAAVVPGFFCWIMHEYLGSQTAASADGRRAGFALGDGSGPAQGRERKGPTAAVLSTTAWNHAPMLGGVAMNLKFTPEPDRAQLERQIADVVTTYCSLGGFEIQVNVVDNATLRAAQADPESYRDLVVRIGGYSDYFTALSPGMQEEVIARSEMQAR